MKLRSSIIAGAGAAGLLIAASAVRAQSGGSGGGVISHMLEPFNLVLATPCDTSLSQDNFDTDTSANWNIFAGSPCGTGDQTVDWALDYSTSRIAASATNTIPPAPTS